MEELRMKRIYNFITVLFIGVLTLVSCTDDSESLEVGKELETVTFKLGFQRETEKEVVNSRATDDENKLYDLHFYVFNVNGDLTGYKKVEYSDGYIAPSGPQEVQITAMTGESYIYAVANINKSTTYYLEKNDKDLLNVTDVASSNLTRNDLLSIQFKRRFGTEGSELFSPNPSDNIFIMSGYLNDGNRVTIQKDLSGNIGIQEGVNVIKLYRILSKNTLTIKSDVTNGMFTPKYYRLANVPKVGVLVPNAGISDVSTYTNGNVTITDVESSYRWNFDGESKISFYYPENLQVAKSNNIQNWTERESNVWNNGLKTFTVASDKASYIEIHGDYVANSGKITANVSYTVHFGDFSPSGRIDNFNVVRNHSYIYEVTVKGVDDIEVEAKRENDNPYAEGLIIDATSGIHYDVDSHYEARVMAFDISTIRALRNNGSCYILNIKTPFGETKETVNVKDDGVYRMGESTALCNFDNVASIFTKEADYKWIKFVKNTRNNRISDRADISKNICKYPGDNSNECLNIFELLAELYNDDAYTENNGTKVYYTCFIDENYYSQKSWTEYVDKESRSMLIANDLNVSKDGKSLYATVAYSVAQRSISTFYTTNYADKKVFGTEIIDEEKKFDTRFNNDSYGSISSRHDWNAWTSAYNTNTTNANKNWYSNTKMVEGVQPLYTTVAKACMSRNRDLDGSGSIEKNEVRWYLAAVDQYRALIFGQNALDSDAYLINRDELEDIDEANWGNDQFGHNYRGKYHYFSCSEGDKIVFWPEESLTTGPLGSGYSFAQLVRCIRTLESGGNGIQDPEPFYTFDKNTFKLDGIVATRNYTEVPLEGHNEIESSNNLYSSFVVAKEDLKGTFTTSNITSGSIDYCSNYQSQTKDSEEKKYSWRTPNQKEFALMLSTIPELSNDDYGMSTRFSGDDKGHGYWEWHDTPGFWSDNGRVNVGNAWNNSVRIRCVRDAQ